MQSHLGIITQGGVTMVHQMLSFESKDAFTAWEHEFNEEEKSLRTEGLMEAPRVFMNPKTEKIAVDLRWKNMDSAKNYLSRHSHYSRMTTEETTRSDEIDTYFNSKEYKMTTANDHRRISHEGIARLADRGIILSKEKKSSVDKVLYRAEDTGIKHLESGKLYTYEEAEKNIRKLQNEDKLKLFTGVKVTYFK